MKSGGRSAQTSMPAIERGSQTIFHGPVEYEHLDKFARYTSPRNEFEAFLGKIFDKVTEALIGG